MKCKICKSEKTQVVESLSKTQVWHCNSCESFFANPVPTLKELEEMYALSSVNEDAGAEKISKNGKIIVPLWKEEEVNDNISLLENHIDKHKRVLDIGCLWGIFLLAMKKKGYDVAAAEVWKPAVEFLKKNHIPVYCATAQTIKSQSKFDIITMFDVLEHVNDLDDTLQRIGSTLKKDGLFMITVPNARGLWPMMIYKTKTKILRKSTDPLPYPFHLYYYSKEGLKKAFERNNFKVVDARTLSTYKALGEIKKLTPLKKYIIIFFSYIGLLFKRGDRLLMIAKKES